MEDRYLFKAKRSDNGEWVQGYYCKWLKGKRVVTYSENETDCIITWMSNGGMSRYEVDPSTICQCTGLKGKNGNLIWENDIVKKDFYTDYDAYANSEKYVGVVKFIDCAWAVETFRYEHKCTRPIFEAMAYSEDVKHFEVIGNIFDNPELLESEG